MASIAMCHATFLEQCTHSKVNMHEPLQDDNA